MKPYRQTLKFIMLVTMLVSFLLLTSCRQYGGPPPGSKPYVAQGING